MRIIDARSIGKLYDDDGPLTIALEDITLCINEGEFVAIMGPSGSGKSTLLHILGLLDNPTSGEYLFDNISVGKLTPDQIALTRNEKIGFVFQAFNLLPRTDVYHNVLLPLMYSRVPEAEWETRVQTAVDAVGLTERIEHEPSELSGGEKQRVAIARAIVLSPSIIFADEPTGNLDSKSGEHIMDIFKRLNSEGRTVVVITHDEKIGKQARRLVKIKDGRIESDTAIL